LTVGKGIKMQEVRKLTRKELFKLGFLFLLLVVVTGEIYLSVNINLVHDMNISHIKYAIQRVDEECWSGLTQFILFERGMSTVIISSDESRHAIIYRYAIWAFLGYVEKIVTIPTKHKLNSFCYVINDPRRYSFKVIKIGDVLYVYIE